MAEWGCHEGGVFVQNFIHELEEAVIVGSNLTVSQFVGQRPGNVFVRKKAGVVLPEADVDRVRFSSTVECSLVVPPYVPSHDPTLPPSPPAFGWKKIKSVVAAAHFRYALHVAIAPLEDG
jgi:hypothetical protein